MKAKILLWMMIRGATHALRLLAEEDYVYPRDERGRGIGSPQIYSQLRFAEPLLSLD